MAIIHWFEKFRARALSVLSLGLALGGVFVPVVAWAMQTWGWRPTAFGSGVLAILFGWPLARVFRRRPEDVGETIDGLPPAGSTEGRPDNPGEREFTARQALRTSAFWLLSLGHGFALLVVYAVSVHAITHMKEGLGYTLAEASLVITLMTVSQVGGVLVGWTIGDRYEKRYVAATCMVMHSAGLLMLTYASGIAMLIAFAILHGGAWGLRGPFMQALRADYFGRRSIGMILGPFGHDHHVRADRRPDRGGHIRGPDGKLPCRIHCAGAARRRRVVVLPVGEATGSQRDSTRLSAARRFSPGSMPRARAAALHREITPLSQQSRASPMRALPCETVPAATPAA